MQSLHIQSAVVTNRNCTPGWHDSTHSSRPGGWSAAGTARHLVRAQAAAAGGAGKGGVHTVVLVLPGGKEAVFRAGSSKSIYDIASYAGVHLPASCKQGTCTACCAKVLSGRVSQPKQKCIPAPLLKEGYVALCCAVPASDVRIQTHQGPVIKRWKAEQANK